MVRLISFLLIGCFALISLRAEATKEDSGWVPIFNGKDFQDFYVYVGQKGYADANTQSMFKVDSGMIKADGPYALLTTLKEYSHYKLRVDYRFAPGTGSKNGGLMVLMDNAAAKTVVDRRPRSIEVNTQLSAPWTLWAGENQGPYITTTVKPGTQEYLPAEKGGVPWTCEAWDANKRVVYSSFPDPGKPLGQWNHGEVEMYGDSGVFTLNGSLRTAGWHFQTRGSPKDPDPGKRVKVDRGGIAVQSEGHVIWYRGWEIMELDPSTRRPIHCKCGCTDPSKGNYDPGAKVDDGSCVGTWLAPGPLAPEARGRHGLPKAGLFDAAGRVHHHERALLPRELSVLYPR